MYDTKELEGKWEKEKVKKKTFKKIYEFFVILSFSVTLYCIASIVVGLLFGFALFLLLNAYLSFAFIGFSTIIALNAQIDSY